MNYMGSLSPQRDRKTLTTQLLVEINATTSMLAQEISCTCTEEEAESKQQHGDIRGELSFTVSSTDVSDGTF